MLQQNRTYDLMPHENEDIFEAPKALFELDLESLDLS
jgi:hypothetical protein